jgi:large subunit ribosomal protein L17
MKKRIGGYKLNRDSAGRLSLMKSLVAAIVQKEEIITTIAKAKAMGPIFEKLLTHAKRGSVADRRLIQSYLQSPSLTKRLVDVIAPKYKDIKGGYTKLVRLGTRRGDNAVMARLSLTKKSVLDSVKSKAEATTTPAPAGVKRSSPVTTVVPEVVKATKVAPKLVKRTGRRGDK